MKIDWSEFALSRHKPNSGYCYSTLSDEEVIQLVRDNFHKAEPGDGETGLDRKIVVPVPSDSFVCSTALLKEGLEGIARAKRRQDGEDLYFESYITPSMAKIKGVKPEPANYAKVVLYSAEALLENGGKRSTNADWEIVCLIASPVDDEPMPPLTMARNQLEKPGGTKSEYSAEEYARAIYYWSQRTKIGTAKLLRKV